MCDLLVLTLCAHILDRKPKKLRLIAAAAIGGAFAALSLFLPRPVSTVLSFPVCFLMLAVCFGFGSLKKYLLTVVVFYLTAFLVSGVVAFLSSFIGSRLPALPSALLLILILLAACFFAFLFSQIVKIRASSVSAELSFTYAGQLYVCTALCDSGDLLTDRETGRSVVIVSGDLFSLPPSPARSVSLTTLTSSGELPLIEAEDVTVNKEKRNACVAVADAGKRFGGYKALLPLSLLLAER